MKRLVFIVAILFSILALATQTQVASDTLQHTACASSCGNGGQLGANWTQNSGLNLTETTSGVSGGGNANGYSYLDLAYWSGAGSFGNDMYSQVTCANSNAVFAVRACGVAVRLTGTLSSQANATGYIFYLQTSGNADGTGTYYLYKSSGGSTTQISTTSASGVSNSWVMNLQVQGSNLTAVANGGTIFTSSDSTIASGGAPGITSRQTGTMVETTWSGGTVGAAARHKAVVTGN